MIRSRKPQTLLAMHKRKGKSNVKKVYSSRNGQDDYEILPDDGSFYGEIPDFDGVYANADTLERCREELEEVLEGWILLRVSLHFPLPDVDSISHADFEASSY